MSSVKTYLFKCWTIMCCFSFLNGCAQQESKTLIPRELLFGNPIKAAPQLSPDSAKLAYLAPDKNNVLNIWIRDLGNTAQPPDKMITSDEKRGIRSFIWQMDSDHILYVQDKEGDENWHIFQTSLQTHQTKDLTPYDGVRASFVKADHHYPDEVLIQMNLRNKTLFDVYRLNLKNGELTLDTENTDNNIGWAADRNLKVRAAQAYASNGDMVIKVRDTIDSPWREFMTVPTIEGQTEVVGFSGDTQSIYILTSHHHDTTRIFKYPLNGGEAELIAADPHFDLSGLIISPTTYELEAAEVERERSDYILLDQKFGKDIDYLRSLNLGDVDLASRDLSNRQWIIAFSSDICSVRYYIYNRDTQKLDFLFSAKPDLDRYTLSPMTPITFEARDGMKIHGYLTLPQGKNPTNLPTVLYVHGGPWARDSWGYSPSIQWLADRGYAVLQINFRGSTGYGKSYLNAGNREWSKKMHTDLLDGKKWMIEKGYTNPDKVAIMGGSYGGYATLVGLTFTPDEFCCGVDCVGPSNLVTLLESIPPYWAPLKTIWNLRVGNLETEKEFLIACSPLFKVNEIIKPLLIAQGANDPRVKQAESDQIVSAMREHGRPVEYLLFKDEGHGFVKPENRMKYYAAVEQFFAKYLGGPSEPLSPVESLEGIRK